MTKAALGLLVTLGLMILAVAPVHAQRPGIVTIGYVELESDARYRPTLDLGQRVVAPHDRPVAGAELALDDAAAVGRMIGRDFVLSHFAASDETLLIDQVVAAVDRHGLRLFVLDLPASAVEHLTEALRDRPVLLFNTTAPDDRLRRNLCAPNLVHVLPSLAMTTDALAQYVVARKWRDVLLLEGPLEDDKVEADAFARAARKFGARIVERRRFTLGDDPRQRETDDAALLTTTAHDYDVVYVADADGRFSRTLPYRTTRPRPVIGATGLVAETWHWTWEGHGAPELIERFLTRTRRHMTAHDWSDWMAVNLIVQAVLRTGSDEIGVLKAYVFGASAYDGMKGLAVSVRPWDHQLRQPILLSTADSVIATAPLPGFLHATNELDTLGDDKSETPCHLAGS
jgi:ABC transporter substrate binding protein (PQQ-dependent alcohol dehydrogenase system)